MQENPCLSCGACCAHYRVSFYWGEADPVHGGTVPTDMTVTISPSRRCMKGTLGKPVRCAALEDEVGKAVHCKIYDHRPSACRAFGPHWENGLLWVKPEDLARCSKARAAWGLPPLPLPAPKHLLPNIRYWLPSHLPPKHANSAHLIVRKPGPLHYAP